MLAARKRLVFDEFLFFLLSVRRLKEKRQDAKSSYPMKGAKELEQLQRELPYALTNAQERVLEEIKKDLESGLVMNRLIQGDVGSGKRIVAVLPFFRQLTMDIKAL